MVKCEIGICRSHYLGKVVPHVSTPPSPSRVQVPITSKPGIGSDRPLRRRCLHPPISSIAAPLRAVSLIIYQWDGGAPKERRCPAGDRALNVLSVLLPHICRYPSHLSLRLPQNQSVCLYHSAAVLETQNFSHSLV